MCRDIYRMLVVSDDFSRPLPYLKTFRELSTVPMFKNEFLREEFLKNHLKEDFVVEVKQASTSDNFDDLKNLSSMNVVILQGILSINIAKRFREKGFVVVVHSSSKRAVEELKKEKFTAYLLSDTNQGKTERTFAGFCAEILKGLFPKM